MVYSLGFCGLNVYCQADFVYLFILYAHLMIVILTALISSSTGSDSGGNGAVEEILPVWDD